MGEAVASISRRTEDACMKRQKRDRLDRAWREGVDGRVNGLFNK